jgi:hypothetical protein
MERYHSFLLCLVNSWAQVRSQCFVAKAVLAPLMQWPPPGAPGPHMLGTTFHFLLVPILTSCKATNYLISKMYIFCVCGTGVWTQGLHLKPLHQPFFVKAFFEIGSCKLFAQAGFNPWSSWSLPPEKLWLQAWATHSQFKMCNVLFSNLSLLMAFPYL